MIKQNFSTSLQMRVMRSDAIEEAVNRFFLLIKRE